MPKFTFNCSLKSVLVVSKIIFPIMLLALTVFGQVKTESDVRPLTVEKPIERPMKGDEVHSYNLPLQAGQFLNVVVEQKGIDVVVILFDSDNKKIAEVDSPNGTQGAEPLSVIIKKEGNYRLDIRSLEKTAIAGRYEVKIKELRSAIEKDKKLLAANIAYNEAQELFQMGTAESLQNAVKKHEEALPLFRAIEDRQREAETLYYIGIIYSALGDKQRALKYINESLPLFHAVGDKQGEAATLSVVGLIYSNLSDNQQALKYMNEALPLFRAIGDKQNEAATLSNIGRVYDDLGDNQQALRYFNDSLQLYRLGGYKQGETATLNNIAKIYSDLGDNQQALKYLNESLPLSRSISDKQGEAATLNNIGRVYIASGELEQALKYFNEALSLHPLVGNKQNEASTLNNIGKVYDELGEKQHALKFFNEALPLLRLVRDKNGEAATLNNLFFSLGSRNPRFSVFFGKQSVNNYQILRSNVQSLDKNIQQTFLKSIEKVYRFVTAALIKQQRYAEAQQVLNFFKDQQFFDFSLSKQFAQLTVTIREAELTTTLNQKLDNYVAAIRHLDAFNRSIGNRQPATNEITELKPLTDKQTAAKEDYLAFLKSAEKEFTAPPDEKDKFPNISDLNELQTALRETSAATKQNTVGVYTLVSEENFHAHFIQSTPLFP
jgi:tetratricopeptide (TPR) repeat protein